MRDPNTEPFRVLSMDDFKSLTTAQKVEYLRRALESLNLVTEQLKTGLEARDGPDEHKVSKKGG